MKSAVIKTTRSKCEFEFGFEFDSKPFRLLLRFEFESMDIKVSAMFETETRNGAKLRQIRFRVQNFDLSGWIFPPSFVELSVRCRLHFLEKIRIPQRLLFLFPHPTAVPVPVPTSVIVPVCGSDQKHRGNNR